MMDKILNKLDNVDEFIGKSIIEKIYLALIGNIFIIVVIQYLFFLLLQVIDLFVEGFYFNNELYMFYYLRFLFFGFSIIVQIVVLISIIVCFSFLDRIEGNDDLQNKIFSTFVKVITAIYVLWTIVLIATFIPRIFILIMNKEKIGIFISTLMYLKLFTMISLYMDLLIMYILNKEKSEKKEKKREK